MKILWLDDDAPESSRSVGDIDVVPARSCAEAVQVLSQADLLLKWIVVDLIVPQGGWGGEYYEMPGLEFIKYVKSEYDNRIGVAVYSLALTPRVRDLILQAGVSKLFEKQSMSLLQVLRELRVADYQQTDRLPSVESLSNSALRERLRVVIDSHIEDHFSSVKPFSTAALIEIYSAVLALEDDLEKRMRAHQTLEVLRSHGEGSLSPPAEQGELVELREIVESMVDEKRHRGEFDVFLCYNSKELPEVESIARSLLASGILPWLDHWQVRPGQRWRVILESTIGTVRSAAVFVGQHGSGPWQDLEVDALLQEFATRKCPVIPVMLSSAVTKPSVPLFLRGANWVDFRRDRSEALHMLIWGITGWKVRR